MIKSEINLNISGSMAHYSIHIFSRFFDFVAILISGLLGFKVISFGMPFSEMPENHLLMLSYAALISLIVFPWFGLYRSWRGETSFHQFKIVWLAWTLVWATVIIFVFTFKPLGEYPRIWLSLWYFVTLLTMFIVRRLIFSFLNLLRAKGLNHKKIIIYGAGDLGCEMLNRVQDAKWTGIDVVALFDDKMESNNTKISGVKLVTDSHLLSEFVEKNNIDEVWFALPLRAENKVKSIMHDLRYNTVNIKLLPDIFGMRLINHSIGEMLGIPIVNLSSTPMSGVNRLVKAIEDKLLSTLIILLLLPLFLIISICIKLSLTGPILYRQERVGWNGKIFTMFKFRTMPVDIEKDTGAVWAKKDEGRTSKFGAFLRRTSLDELPQFFNVLKGEMSIVGPRPERKVFVDKFKEEIPDYMKKHLVKAGVTGWAQINDWRGNTDLNKRIEFDIHYIENWSLLFDLKIILLTLFKGFTSKNAY